MNTIVETAEIEFPVAFQSPGKTGGPVIGEPGGDRATFCTVSENPKLLGEKGEVITTFGRICIDFQQYIRENHMGNPHVFIASRINLSIVQNIANDKIDRFQYVTFRQRFFRKDAPEVRLIEFPIGGTTRNCPVPSFENIDHQHSIFSLPSLMDKVHHMGTLIITHVLNGPRC